MPTKTDILKYWKKLLPSFFLVYMNVLLYKKSKYHLQKQCNCHKNNSIAYINFSTDKKIHKIDTMEPKLSIGIVLS